LKRLLVIVLLAVTAGCALRAFVLEGIWVASGSMEPQLPVGTHYFVNKLTYHFREPRRGEIIVFRSPIDQQKGLIKRVIALPGDEVEVRDKRIYLNGTPLAEPYAIYKRATERLVGDNVAKMTIPPDCFYVLGDNRDESEDSSVWRDPQTKERIYCVPRSNVQGQLLIP
jgi:signal peptidase I